MAVAAEAVQAQVVALQITRQRREVGGFAVAAQQQMQRAVHLQAVQRRFGAADVGGFGIVDPAHAVVFPRQLEAVRQAGKGGQRLQAGGARDVHRVGQRQRRQRIGVVMAAGQFHLAGIQHFLTLHPQPGFALLSVQVVVAHVGAEADAARVGAAHRHGQRVVRIHHADAGIFINAQFGAAILLQAKRVTIHMVFGNVQDGRRRRPQAVGGFQLEARQLQHVQPAFLAQQAQRRQADIAADAHRPAGRLRHLAHQGGDGALAVGTGDRHDRRLGFAAEQLYVADDFHPGVRRGAQRRGRQGHARAGDDQIRRQQPVLMQIAQMAFYAVRQLVQPRR